MFSTTLELNSVDSMILKNFKIVELTNRIFGQQTLRLMFDKNSYL